VSGVDFGPRAASYDRLRPQDEAWWERFRALVAQGDLRGRRVLDVGCGTGALAAALAEHAQARVWGVEASPEMLAVARARVPRGVGLRLGRAEALPFRDRWFERVVFSLVLHLVDRPAALAEAHRVLGADGRVAIATFSHGHFDRWWAAPFFPSLPDVDRARFPSEEELVNELAGAGFEDVLVTPLTASTTIDRATALAKLRGRHISTFDLLDEAEIEQGIARAERELPARVEIELGQLVVTAHRYASA
jgi:SAM-dependent methyltransferase